MRLIVITPENDLPGETLLAARMLENGLHRLHIRKPGYSASQLRTYVQTLPPDAYHQLIIHNHYSICGELGLGGVHFSAQVRESGKQNPGGYPSVSTSFHTWEEVKAQGSDFASCFISPVFNSISKPGYLAGVNWEGLYQTRQHLAALGRSCPEIIGLGGVTPDKLGMLHSHGFDGAAMLGAIWQAEYPFGIFTEAMDAIIDLEDY